MRSPLLRRPRWLAPLCFTALTLGPSVAFAAGVDPTAATPQQKFFAQSHFTRARGALTLKNLPLALDEFRASYDVVASPNTRFSIARCLRDMNRLPEAYIEFGKTDAEATAAAASDPRYAQTADAAKKEQDAVATQIGLVTVTITNADPDATLTVAGAAVDRASWTLAVPVAPGAIEVVLSSGGKQIAKQSVTVAAGEKKVVAIDAKPVVAPPPVVPVVPPTTAKGGVAHDDDDDNPWEKQQKQQAASAALAPVAETNPRAKLRPYAYVAGGVGAAGLLTFAIFGLLEKSTYSGLQTDCPNHVCPSSKFSDVSTGQTQQTVANIGLIVGAVGVAAGATLFVLSLPKSSASSSSASLVVAPSFIGLRGSL
jgi:hypothetical protein